MPDLTVSWGTRRLLHASEPSPPKVELPIARFIGHFDVVNGRIATGWVYDDRDPSATLTVEFFTDGHLLGETLANEFREDLVRANIANPRCGFRFTLPVELFEPGERLVSARVKEGAVDLSGSPRLLPTATLPLQGIWQPRAATAPAPPPADIAPPVLDSLRAVGEILKTQSRALAAQAAALDALLGQISTASENGEARPADGRALHLPAPPASQQRRPAEPDDLSRQLKQQRLLLEKAIGERDHAISRLADLEQRASTERSRLARQAISLQRDIDRLGQMLGAPSSPAAAAGPGPAAGSPATQSLADRYGPLFAEATRKLGAGHDVLWFGVIDWHFRVQRPQHLAMQLANSGARVFYISIVFEPADANGRFRILGSMHRQVFEVRLRVAGDADESIYRGLSDATVSQLQLALDELIAMLGLRVPIVVVDHPAWHRVACGVAGATVVYDCLDLATGFSDAAASLEESEAVLLTNADLVVAASRPLAEYVAGYRSNCSIVRNAADVALFTQAFVDRPSGERPVIGYYGAIADWFNIEWIESCAVARPQWDFWLIGRTAGCDTTGASRLANVRFFGELPYDALPAQLREFDVAVIPFKMPDLIKCTNPVKLYEYMSAGKAVVSAPLPEVIEVTDLAYIAEDASSFAAQIDRALAEDGPALRARRRAWAQDHTWSARATELMALIDGAFPPVSVVVLTYNNWTYTEACLFSLCTLSDYPNLEIIVVDNASTDGTRAKLTEMAKRDPRMHVVLNHRNAGFAGGNNIGLRVARGEFVVLLNNDTYVTRGWVRDLIRPMRQDGRIGMVGPVTNQIGNEQKVKIAYGDMAQMEQATRQFARAHLRQTFEVDTLAFFCVAIRREVLDEAGELSEAYGIGFFEDDDYCRRVKAAGYRLVIADDVFVHHHGSASFGLLGNEVDELMRHNRAVFEERWGLWRPHRYRDAPGFG